MEDFNEDLEIERIKKARKVIDSKNIEEMPITEKEVQVTIPTEKSNYELQSEHNGLVEELTNNTTAIEIAKQQHNSLKNQKRIAKKMGEVVGKKANTDIETADLKVEQQRIQNTLEKARQKNELLKCKAERKLLIKESRHNLEMQKFRHRKEKYGDLLLRHCRKKIKNEKDEWVYQYDENGNALINMPNGFVLFWLVLFDSVVMFLNQIAEVVGSLNKVVRKIIWVMFILLIVLVQPIRQAVLRLIGIKF